MNSIEVKNSICIITLNNPPHNYLSKPEFISATVLSNTITDHNCKAIIITGTGRHFSAGANLDELKKMVNDNTINEEITNGKQLLQTIIAFNLPVIASIEGSCLGGGLELALQADIKIASTKALFAFPEANLNLMPGLGGTVKTTQVAGKAKALELILKGDIIDAQTALELGIIDHIKEPKTTFDHAFQLALSITNNRSIEVIQAVIQSVRNAEKLEYHAALEQETKLFCQLASNALKNS